MLFSKKNLIMAKKKMKIKNTEVIKKKLMVKTSFMNLIWKENISLMLANNQNKKNKTKRMTKNKMDKKVKKMNRLQKFHLKCKLFFKNNLHNFKVKKFKMKMEI